ncbi:hypothetical protein [Planomonospora sphaerica]|uniref:hypothetical protein n=1 Tax=Planomonospora sphaerica TaxID=161355 RepID=UPI0018D0394A|nr:hypothetical protein [Planomonospora sphaerica]
MLQVEVLDVQGEDLGGAGGGLRRSGVADAGETDNARSVSPRRWAATMIILGMV